MGYWLSLQGGGVIIDGSVTTEATQSSLYQGVSDHLEARLEEIFFLNFSLRSLITPYLGNKQDQ